MPAHDDMTVNDGEAGHEAAGEPVELLLMRAGHLLFAVRAAEVETVTPWSRPAPLPHAPAAVLGVVSARGRMRTVLDPARLLEGGDEQAEMTYDFVACLRGDEQLALAFESAERAHLGADELEAPPTDAVGPVHGSFARGVETVLVLDSSKLFAAAVRGTERRRPRRAL
jgi:chemotaxis signal transduction protein